MKNKLKRSLIAASFMLILKQANAQSAHMHMHHEPSSDSKNIFLTMMDNMMVKMDDVPPFISPESDFIWQMIPHHEGAIAMAQYEIGHGKDHEMIQLAKSILTEQTSEIQQMKISLKQLMTEKSALPSGYLQLMNQSMAVMMDQLPSNEALKDVDHAFAQVMIPHHQAAIDMAKVALKFSQDQKTGAFAKQIISSEEVEIEQMSAFIN